MSGPPFNVETVILSRLSSLWKVPDEPSSLSSRVFDELGSLPPLKPNLPTKRLPDEQDLPTTSQFGAPFAESYTANSSLVPGGGSDTGLFVGLDEGESVGFAVIGLRVGLGVGDLVGLVDPQDPNEVDVELPNAPAVMAAVPSTVTSIDPIP